MSDVTYPLALDIPLVISPQAGHKLRIEKRNGKCIIDANLSKLAPKAKNVTGLKRTQGFIGLQNHASPVYFRKIQIKRLP